MPSSIQQIKQDIANLEKTVTEVGQELQSLYDQYLDLLSQSVQKQLILASYQICTQVYPESFLRLSLDRRQKLQRNLKNLGKDFKVTFWNNLEKSEQVEERQNGDILEEMLKNLPLVPEQAEEQEDLLKEKLPIEASEILEQSQKLEEPTKIFNDTDELDSETSELKQQENINLPNPEYLILWQQKVERIIKKTLDYTSKEANKCLQEVNIIPSHLPTKIIDVALQAEEASSGGNKFNQLANILNLVIETEKKQKAKPTSVTPISLLRLRLSEIEFADPVLSNQRYQIRDLLKKIDKMRQRYQTKKREYAIAEAEAAWRSSWYED
ncbi:hypothetical protein IQ238_09245 [Pleurocapsales cyanobacterium LEGE 06147]|nr:hypothetical protein [Pleurocapsales cyanobacterium LEGE 06147]